jgi:hypothetical protein
MKSQTTHRRKKNSTPKDVPDVRDGREFDALSDADKEKVWESYNRPIPQSELRPLNSRERAIVRQQKRKMGRPTIGQGVKVISLSVEKGLLKRADTYAKLHGMKRAELFTQGLLTVLPKAS